MDARNQEAMRVPSVFICHDTVHDGLFRRLEQELSSRRIHVVRGDMPRAGTPAGECAASTAGWREADVVVMTVRQTVSREMLASAPGVRAVVFPTIGVEGLDLDAASEFGVVVAHGATPENHISMAEATVMLVLASIYDLKGNEKLLREGRASPPPSHAAGMLWKKKVGLIGYGQIARAVAARLSAFGCGLSTYSPTTPATSIDSHVASVDLASLLRESDVVCVLARLNDATRRLIGEREFRQMKPGAYLVNTARGEILDQDALYAALASGHLAGAALDTFETEPLPEDSPLRELNNVILTPHRIGHTRELMGSLLPAAVENISRILDGEAPLYCRNPEILNMDRG